ncbi:KpsF/GutQ family sugar-phosphate isomerase [Pleionea sediminis]|uniref:KpsF/GutQ family sugar-phosphate isomerase n=1 Tax=Pleionea sediminis TaxID=2569479 RepID=UPI0011851781|nr:KpsF/GutQ family sugar-phosphate isomerase [Pleionea sediminis]
MSDHKRFIELGRSVINIEKQAIEKLQHSINGDFARACELLINCQGRVVVTGMGKSGHIANKIAATLASTGSPAFFVHPGEASHGDLGMITRGDVVLALSNSGETGEITGILPVLKRKDVPLISMTGNKNSTLAQLSDVNLDTSVEKEACPLNLAPTASTTTALVMGDALAVALLDARGFSPDDFALSHPGGSLGRKLLLKVEDIMHQGDSVPRVTEQVLLKDALLEITQKRLGMTAIIDDSDCLKGIFTDGDLRRSIEKKVDFSATPIHQVMTINCQTVTPDMLAAEAVQIMEKKAINSLIVVDKDNCVVGALNMHDLLKAGVV